MHYITKKYLLVGLLINTLLRGYETFIIDHVANVCNLCSVMISFGKSMFVYKTVIFGHGTDNQSINCDWGYTTIHKLK